MLIRTLATGATIAGGAALAACTPTSGAASGGSKELPPPETTTLRIANPPTCDPGMWLASGYLREEGFTDVQFIDAPFYDRAWLTKGLADVAPAHPQLLTAAIDAGLPITVLAGLHTGCFELWVDQSIRNVGDLRGRRIAVRAADMTDEFYVFFAAILGYQGIALRDVHFVEAGDAEDYNGMRTAYLEGRADAFFAGGAQGPFLRRAKAPGHVVLDTMMDKPWSTYFCCHLAANRDWARQYPIATKRLTRAVLRASDAAARDRARAVSDSVVLAASMSLANGKPNTNFRDGPIVTETMAMCTYNWRDVEPAETLRFFGLRLADAKLIKSTPQQLIDRGTDFAYVRQLRTELRP